MGCDFEEKKRDFLVNTEIFFRKLFYIFILKIYTFQFNILK
jgi:hypothetical protein